MLSSGGRSRQEQPRSSLSSADGGKKWRASRPSLMRSPPIARRPRPQLAPFSATTPVRTGWSSVPLVEVDDSDEELGEHLSGLSMNKYSDVARGGVKQLGSASTSAPFSSSSARSTGRSPSSSSFSAYQHYSRPLPCQLPSHPLPIHSAFSTLPIPPASLPSSATHYYASSTSSSSTSSGSTSGYSTASSSPQYTPCALPPPTFSALGAAHSSRGGSGRRVWSGVSGEAEKNRGETIIGREREIWEADEGRETWPKEVTRTPWNYKGQ